VNDKTESRKTKARSPNFPFITLDKAIERAKEFYDQEKRGTAPFPVAAAHWHYRPTSSGALQTVAALKSYGLIYDEGTGAARQLRLTVLALRILLDSRPDSPERDALRRQAALMPAVIADIYARWEGSLPSPSNLYHYLILDKEFNEETAKRACDIIFENEKVTNKPLSGFESAFHETVEDDITGPEFASQPVGDDAPPDMNPLPGPTGPTGPSFSFTPLQGPTTGPTGPSFSFIPLPPGKQLFMPDGTSPRRHDVRPNPAAKLYGPRPRREERIIGPTGDIVLSYSAEPTWETYEFLRKYIDLRQSMLKPAAPSTTEPGIPVGRVADP
jgi:hypothetical protein